MTAIEDNVEKKFDFEADAYLIRQLQNEAMATTGQREMLNSMQSAQTSEPGRLGQEVYKFKNIHGDRGTYAGLSSQAQN